MSQYHCYPTKQTNALCMCNMYSGEASSINYIVMWFLCAPLKWWNHILNIICFIIEWRCVCIYILSTIPSPYLCKYQCWVEGLQWRSCKQTCGYSGWPNWYTLIWYTLRYMVRWWAGVRWALTPGPHTWNQALKPGPQTRPSDQAPRLCP